MRRKKLKIGVWGEGLPKLFRQILSRKYDVEIVKGVRDDSDLFFTSENNHPIDRKFDAHNCLRVFFTGDGVRPDFRFFDYAFSSEEATDKNCCLPFFAWSLLFEEFRTGRYGKEIREYREYPKSKFCAFVYTTVSTHPGRTKRIEFCKKLMSYKRVDCPGPALNNAPLIGREPVDKLNFIKQHKFTIAFENRRFPHYVTEKIFQALLVNSIPIYWGSPRIAEYFNPEAFINCHDYDSFDQVMDRVIEVDNNDDLYQKYVNAPPILEGSKAHAITEELIMEWMDKIVNSIDVVTPVCNKRFYKLWLLCYRPGYYLAKKYSFIYRLKSRVWPGTRHYRD